MRLTFMLCVLFLGCGSETPTVTPSCKESRSLTKDYTAKTTHEGQIWTLRFFPRTGVEAIAIEAIAAIDGATQQRFSPGLNATLVFEPHDSTSTVVIDFTTSCLGGSATQLRARLSPNGLKPDGSIAQFTVTLSDAT